MFHLMLFVNKFHMIGENNHDLVSPHEHHHHNELYRTLVNLDNHLCELAIQRLRRVDVEDSSMLMWQRLFKCLTISECEQPFKAPFNDDDILKAFKKHMCELLYVHVKKSPFGRYMSESNRELLEKLVVENQGRFQPLSLKELCRLQVIEPSRYHTNAERIERLPQRLRTYLSFRDEFAEHSPFFLLV